MKMMSQTAFQPAFHLRSSSGEATMQIETNLTREHRSVTDAIESTTSLAGLSLTFDGEILGRMGQESCWNPAQANGGQTIRSVTDLSGTVADPFTRNDMTPVAPPSMQPTDYFVCGLAGQEVGLSQGNRMLLQGGLGGHPFPTQPVPVSSPPRHHPEFSASCTLAGMTANCTVAGNGRPSHVAPPPPLPPSPQDGLPAGVRLPQRRGATQLWEFLLEMLNTEGNGAVVCWLNKAAHEFRVLDPDELARRWGELKGRPRMNYDKLSRSLRYYYQKKLLAKVPTEKYVYQFLCPPSALYDALGGRDKRKKSRALTITDQDETLSPASGECSLGESDSDISVDVPSQGSVPCGVESPTLPISTAQDHSSSQPALRQRLTAPSCAKVTYSTLWRPPSPPSPSQQSPNHMVDQNKVLIRHHPYKRQNSYPGSHPSPTSMPPSCMKTLPVSTAANQQHEAQFGADLSLSLPANLHLGDFSVDFDPSDNQLFENVTPESSVPQSPHSIQSDHSNDSDTSEGLETFLRNFIEDENIDLTFCLEDMDQPTAFPVAAIAPWMPPFL